MHPAATHRSYIWSGSATLHLNTNINCKYHNKTIINKKIRIELITFLNNTYINMSPSTFHYPSTSPSIITPHLNNINRDIDTLTHNTYTWRPLNRLQIHITTPSINSLKIYIKHHTTTTLHSHYMNVHHEYFLWHVHDHGEQTPQTPQTNTIKE